MNELPTGWEEACLLDLCQPKQWKVISTSELTDTGYVVYGANGKIGFYSTYTHDNPTLMITCRGATCGNLHISETQSYINGNAMALDKLAEQATSIGYLKYALLARGLTDVITGTAQPQITRQSLSKVMVKLAPLAEQTRIVVKLDELLAQIDTLKARIDGVPALLKRFRQSVLTAAVSGQLTEEWRDGAEASWGYQRAAEVCEKVQSGGTPKEGFSESGVPFLKVYNIVNQQIDFEYRPQYISKNVHHHSSSKSITLPGDVVMNIVGPPLGKVATIPSNHPEWNINQAITLFRPSKNIVSGWISIILLGGENLRNIINETKGSAGQINISLSQCRNFVFPVPDVDEQGEIVRRVNKLFTFADQLESRVKAAQARIDRLNQSILAKAFRGELVPQDPNDEPAGVLLERIKAQRATAPVAKRSRRTATLG